MTHSVTVAYGDNEGGNVVVEPISAVLLFATAGVDAMAELHAEVNLSYLD